MLLEINGLTKLFGGLAAVKKFDMYINAEGLPEELRESKEVIQAYFGGENLA